MSLRNEKVRKALMREISDVIFREIKDPKISAMVSITNVEVSSDNSSAKVYFSVFGDNDKKAETIEALEKHKGQIRHFIGQRIRLRKTPLITLIPDDSLEKGAQMMELINKIERGEI